MLEYQIHCYQKKWVLDAIINAVDKVSCEVTNTYLMEGQVMNYVGRYIAEHDIEAKNKKYITRLIYQKIHRLKTQYRSQHVTHFADLGFEDDSGELVEFDPVDVLANVDADSIITKETTTLLAKDDRRKEFVLNAWLVGFSNDSELSLVLADEFNDTQPSGHRSFIKRFRNDCRTLLSSTAI